LPPKVTKRAEINPARITCLRLIFEDICLARFEVREKTEVKVRAQVVAMAKL
jgi:hypothetical protein